MQTTCYRCGTVDPFPVLIRVIERMSGPSAGVYACAPCAQRDYFEHSRMCRVCQAGERCQSSSELRAAMLDARRARLGKI